MSEKERGRLFPIRIDGTESVPYFIKKDRVTFGRSDNSDIRVYIDGVEPEHCTVLFNREGEGFLDPLNKCGLTLLNGEIIGKKKSLYHNDVITIVKRSFRFLYPSSSHFCARSYQFVPSLEDNMLQDFIGTESEMIKQKEICQKRVTFGPTLSPEEFDKNLPPASPVRKGSLPGDKNSAQIKLSFKRNLFENVCADSVSNDAESSEINIPSSAVVLQRLPRLSCTSKDNTLDQPNIDLNKSRPLFSDILKKCTKEPGKDFNVKKIFQKSPPRKLQKKTSILQNSKQLAKSVSNPRILAVGSTGHANSPETIIVCKKKRPSEFAYKNSFQSGKLQNEEKFKSPSSCSSKILDEKHNECSQGSEDDLQMPAFHKYSKHDCPNIDKNCILKNAKVCSCVSSNKLSKTEENLNAFSSEENISVEQRIASDLLSSTLITENEDGEDQSNEYNFLQDNAMQQLCSHSNISPTFNNESFLDICMNALKKFALTISMMSACHMYNKVMEDMSNYSMYFPSTSFDSCNFKCSHRSSSHHNEGQMDIAKLAWFQGMMQNFLSNSVCNKVFEEERCMLRSCENNLNSDAPSMCHRKMKKSNIVSTLPFRAADSECSPSKCKGICSHDNSVWRKESNETADERNSAIKNPCSYETSILQCHTKPPQISEASVNAPSSTSEHSPNCLTMSSIPNISINEFSEYSNVTRKKNTNSKENDVPHSYFEKLNYDRSSFSGIKKKCMRMIRKSFSPTCFKRGKMSGKHMSFINDPSSENTFSEDLVKKRLRSRNLVAVKTKQRKSSLGVNKIGITSSRKFRAKAAKKRESCKTRREVIKSCEDQILNDPEQLEHLRIRKVQKVKRGVQNDCVVPKRITRATVKGNNVITSKSVLMISPVQKVADCEISEEQNFQQVKLEVNNNIHVMRTNKKRSSLTSKRITRTAAKKRNVKKDSNTFDTVEVMGGKSESTATPVQRRKNEKIKGKEPCKTEKSELPKKRVLRLPCELENSRKRRIAQNDVSMDDSCINRAPKRSRRRNETVEKKQNQKTAASSSEESKVFEFHCDSGNRKKRRIANDETNCKNISMTEKKKNNSKVKDHHLEVSPIQRITRSMVQKRKRREK